MASYQYRFSRVGAGGKVKSLVIVAPSHGAALAKHRKKYGEPLNPAPAKLRGKAEAEARAALAANSRAAMEGRKPGRTCKFCGCTDERACPGGCHWVEENVCSACVEGFHEVEREVAAEECAKAAAAAPKTCADAAKAAMEKCKFKRGDVVRLISGGHEMTVSEIDWHHGDAAIVTTVWSRKGSIKFDEFAADMLVSVDNDIPF